ncbi:hypothetical protein JTB14_012854 [Gonioctena quinquepunctata]|nr:hypothetical protein JTB14_012854 [Gonioctena quinquepunctata]
MNELHAFMGILLAAGRNHSGRLFITEMWCKGELFRQPFFTAAMLRDRYKEIFRNIRFDDPTTKAERIENTKDKLQAIRTLYDQFTQNCIRQYSPGANITVDERLATFRGECPFRVYMKNEKTNFKPEIILHYNKTNVDTGDKMTHEYSCARAVDEGLYEFLWK